MRDDWKLADIKRFERSERDLAGYVRNLIDHHDATDDEIHGLVQGMIDTVRRFQRPSWQGWESDPRALAIIAEREKRFAANDWKRKIERAEAGS